MNYSKIVEINNNIKEVQQQLSDWYSEYEYMNSHQSSDLNWNQVETDMIDERIELENKLNYLSEKKQQMFEFVNVATNGAMFDKSIEFNAL